MREKISTIDCSKCDREWPTVSEQGVCIDVYGHCYHCMLTGISAKLLVLQGHVDYAINTCNECAGVEKRRHDCKQCGGSGYMVDKKVTVDENG